MPVQNANTRAASTKGRRDNKGFSITEWGACLAATLVAIWLHIYNFYHAGVLWRDEAGGLGLATLPTLRELWSSLNIDSFPMVMPLALRALNGLGANSDAQLRCFGLVIGLAVMASIWLVSATCTRRPPTIALTLLALNGTFIRWGDSLRAYGLGCFFIIVTLGLVYAFVRQPTRKGFLLAALGAVLSVQTLFQNAFLLAAICGGAWSVCASRKAWKTSRWVLALGLLSALSLLPYVSGVMRSQAWWALQKTGFSPGFVWQNLLTALGSPSDWQAWIWFPLVLAGIGTSLNVALRKVRGEHETVIYFGITLIGSIVGFFVFLWTSGLPTQVWYFVPLMALMAVCADLALRSISFPEFQMGRLVLLILATALAVPANLEWLNSRITNVDILTQKVAARASADDLVILDPWYCGTSFRRYYHGSARWTTTPPLADTKIQRFDLLRQKMMADEPIKTLLEMCSNTLTNGHRVWIVGYGFQIPIEPPVSPPKAPAQGWNELPYELAWSGQVLQLASSLSLGVTTLTSESSIPVSPYEDLHCLLFTGKLAADAKP